MTYAGNMQAYHNEINFRSTLYTRWLENRVHMYAENKNKYQENFIIL